MSPDLPDHRIGATLLAGTAAKAGPEAVAERGAGRDVALDLGRCVAALFVIYVHHSVGYLYLPRGTTAWLLADLLNTLGHAACPFLS